MPHGLRKTGGVNWAALKSVAGFEGHGASMVGELFTCNICGHPATFPQMADGRENASCMTCHSSVRMRGIVHNLTTGLFGRSMTLDEMPTAPIKGLGLSDWDGYAGPLARKLDYVNSFYHCEPRFDITEPVGDHADRYDFLISSDVFEHVRAPVQAAFDHSYAILKPGGLLVLTVPSFEGIGTVEHYPDLGVYSVFEFDGEWVMLNKSKAGFFTLHRELVFHGGPGTTLEMRMFGLTDLVRNLELAGFTDVKVHDEPVPQWGILPPHRQGLPITARRPADAPH